MNISNPNILIIGKGYIGDAVQKHLQCDIKSSDELNYHDPSTLRRHILNRGIETIINCSGFTGKPNVDEAEFKKELCWRLNVESPLAVNKVCDDLGVKYIHISSGCIYEGYFKEWTEHDTPNFGLFQNHSSFYSKSKHAFENLSKDMNGAILRIRMPLGHDISSRDYLEKIRKYDNLVEYENSKTYIPDLCEVVRIISNKKLQKREIVNVVNPSPLRTSAVCDIMKKYGCHNNNWNFVPISSLNIVANRSNCVLNSDKVMTIHPMLTETEAIEKIMKDKQERCIMARKEAIERDERNG